MEQVNDKNTVKSFCKECKQETVWVIGRHCSNLSYTCLGCGERREVQVSSSIHDLIDRKE